MASGTASPRVATGPGRTPGWRTDPTGLPGIVRVTAVLIAAYVWTLFASSFVHPGAIGIDLGKPGADWSGFFSALQSAVAGHGVFILDRGHRIPFLYPPSYLLMLLPFGRLTSGVGYAAFETTGALLLAIALCVDVDVPRARAFVIACALLCPATAINVALGQNAFLSTALLIGGFRAVRKRPLIGGALLGALSFKPQFWILVPIALIALRQWKALSWSFASAVALTAASAAVFRPNLWPQWLHLALTGYWNSHGTWSLIGRMSGDSVWACLVTSGVSPSIANLAQIAAVVIGATLVYRSFRLPLPADQKLAVLLGATIFVAPHFMAYDMLMIAVAVSLWLVETAPDGCPSWKWLLACLLWFAPLMNPPAAMPLGRLTPLFILGFIGAVLSRPHRPISLPEPAPIHR